MQCFHQLIIRSASDEYSSSVHYEHQHWRVHFTWRVQNSFSRSHKIFSLFHFSFSFQHISLTHFCYIILRWSFSHRFCCLFEKFSRFSLALSCFSSDQFEILWTKTFRNRSRKSAFKFAIFYEQITSSMISYSLTLRASSRILSKIRTHRSHSSREKLASRSLRIISLDRKREQLIVTSSRELRLGMVRGPNQIVRFGFGFWFETKPNRKLKNQIIDISVWFGSRRFEISTNRQQKSTYEDVEMHS